MYNIESSCLMYDIELCSFSAAVERAKERRRIVIIMHRVTQILLYILPTLSENN